MLCIMFYDIGIVSVIVHYRSKTTEIRDKLQPEFVPEIIRNASPLSRVTNAGEILRDINISLSEPSCKQAGISRFVTIVMIKKLNRKSISTISQG